MILRPMKMADADFMLSLKNYPETRRFAIATHAEIKKEDHYKWLEGHISEFKTIFNDRGEAVGAIRIAEIENAYQNKDHEVSIWIDRSLWRSGIATYILQHECERGMIAKIVEGNIASMRAFIRAGFLPTTYQPVQVMQKAVHNPYPHVEPTGVITAGFYIFKKI